MPWYFWIGAVYVLSLIGLVIILAWDARMYPVCRECDKELIAGTDETHGNLHTRRLGFLDNWAYCSRHNLPFMV